MNILYLSSDDPQSKNGYGANCGMHRRIIERLGEENGRAIVLRYCLTDIEEVPGRVIYVKSRKQSTKFAAALMGYPPDMGVAVVRRTMQAIRQYDIDIVYIDNSISGKLVKLIKKKHPEVKVITFFHDLEAIKMRKDTGYSLLRKIALPVYIRNEQLTVDYSDRTIVLNQRDADLYRQVYGKDPFMLAPIGLNMPSDVDKGLRHQANTSLSLLFVGVVYDPNLNAIRWFLQNVLPQVKSDITFNIVGKNMEKYKDEFESASDCVHVLGTVDSLDPCYIEADVAIVPLFEGGGMKIKTAEAFSYGKHYIGTTEGMEGYWEELPDSLRGKKIFRSDDPAEFAAIIDRLAGQDFPKYDAEVRKFAEENYSFNRIYECYRKTFEF